MMRYYPWQHLRHLPSLLIIFVSLGHGLDIPLDAAELQYPVAVVAAPGGSIYVADRKLPGIWKLENGKGYVDWCKASDLNGSDD